MNKQRRELLRLLSATGVMLTLSQDDVVHGDVLERLAHALKKTAPADQSTLLHLQSVIRRERQQFVESEGTGWHDLLGETLGHLDIITRFLEVSQPSAIFTQLCVYAGETALLASDICFNAGKNELAMRYYLSALEAAKEAHHPLLQATILGRMSFIPIYNKEPERALPLLGEAQTLLGPDTADIIPACLWAIEGEVYASMGDAVASVRALEKAERMMARGRPGNVSMCFEEDVARGIFDPFKLLSYKGVCSVRLKQPELAQVSLRTSIEQTDLVHLQHRSIVLVDLGMTYAQQGDIREAYNHASQAASLIGQTESGRVLQRLLALRQELNPWKNTKPVRQLDEELISIFSSERLRVAYEQ